MKILHRLIDPQKCDIISNEINAERSRITKLYPNKSLGHKLVPASFSAYGLAVTEQLLLDLTPTIEQGFQKKLYPTYSYCRIYNYGAILEPHIDREACEISLSLNVGGDQWPIWFDYNGVQQAILDQGDGVVYMGLETPHWREQFKGDYCTQVFLHWVDSAGPYASWKYDRRPSIGTSMQSKTYWGKS